MQSVPVRKILNIFFVRVVSTESDSRRRYCQKWLLFIVILLCFYVFYHKITQHISLSVNMSNMAKNDPKLTVTKFELPLCETNENQNDGAEEKSVKNLTDGLFPEIKPGGYYYPRKCRSKHKVAILVPYRNRKRNLQTFLYYMHPFLIRQQLEYRIFVIEQAGMCIMWFMKKIRWKHIRSVAIASQSFSKESFNRGKLLNIGFVKMMKYNDWSCVVLHDVDFLPQSDRILYTCPPFPRQMLGFVVDGTNLTYDPCHNLFGGVSAISVEHYRQINGFSNLYWGWGGEDNDIYWRIQYVRLPMMKYGKPFAVYKSLPHAEQPRNDFRYDLLKFAMARYKMDGLSSLVYKVIWTKCHKLYTHILADVNPLKENITQLYNELFS